MRRYFLAVALLLLRCSARADDLTIVSKTRFGDKDGTQTVFLSSGRMKTSSGGGDSIVNLWTGEMSFLDEEKKTYYVTSIKEMEEYAAGRQAQSKGSGFNADSFGTLGEPSARRTGLARRIAGHPCDGWTIRMGDGLVFDVCAARDIPAPPGYFQARGAAYAGMGPMGRHFARMFEAMKATKGYPLSLAMHVRLEGMKQESLTEAARVTPGAIPASAFDVPADYTKKKSPFSPG